ncbi:M56 family metallopeptidase [Streptomyces sp. BE133]|uniref:M56 family metallopeptidase n=1 Tax=Streptomyces sp. BE133 TaxID=3002523 RepID=UPI002E79D403|nr:M56 family metallopeptidase [Streptomyces sp. BE133]MEE1810103.1 M56 family metallopeptidase [Streptomyces sp. BE133]
MNAAPALIGYAAAIGLFSPRVMLRSAWPHRAPALAAATWQALAASFSISVALAAYHLATPTEHLHAGVMGILHSCGVALGAMGSHAPTMADRLAVALPVAVALALAAGFAFQVVRARRARSRHRAVLDMVGRRSYRLDAIVVEHTAAAAYCLPGRHPRIVVSEGAVRLLSPEQLDAVLEHERAHVAGRHHLALAAVEAFSMVFLRVPLARHAREQTALLLEMIADDRALRRHSRDVLASAMYEMAAARAPRGAFAMGGDSALVRLQRVLGPRRGTHPALRGSVAAAAITVPLLPLLVTCPLGIV